MEQVGQPGQQRERYALHPPLVEIVAQGLDHLALYGQVDKVVRLVLPQDAVLFRLDFSVCLGYREVVRRDQLPVLPRPVELILVTEPVFTGQEVHNQDDRRYDGYRPDKEVLI